MAVEEVACGSESGQSGDPHRRDRRPDRPVTESYSGVT